MTALELWTMVRFTLYPIMLVFGLAWSLFHFRTYRQGRCASDAWAGWLGAAVALNGAAGFGSLLVASGAGFGPLSSMVFTIGPAVITATVASGVVALWWSAWKR